MLMPMKPTRWTIFILLFFQLFCLRTIADAAESMELVLMDGTVVHGTLDSFTDGVYTIKSNSLGLLHIEAGKVKSIRSENAPASTAEGQQSLQTTLAGNPAVMDLVNSLQQDPDFQAVLKDKEILRAITAGDLSRLESNSKLQKLLDKPVVQEIEKKLR